MSAVRVFRNDKEKILTEQQPLKPCPFCGSSNILAFEEELGGDWFCGCDECLARGPLGFNEITARELWNQQARRYARSYVPSKINPHEPSS